MPPRKTLDVGRTGEDDVRSRGEFPDAFFARLAGMGIGVPDQRVLDLATGTGALARELALRGCAVTALDRSDALLGEAERLDREAGVSVRFVKAPAEETGLPEAFFDVVVAAQAWHGFDRPRASAEAKRLLVPGGALVVAHVDWIPLPGNTAETTDRLLSVYNPKVTVGDGTGMYPSWLRDLAMAGLRDLETFSFDTVATYTHEAWRARVRASAAAGASLSADEVEAFDRDLRHLLERKFKDPMEVPHRVWAVVARRPRP